MRARWQGPGRASKAGRYRELRAERVGKVPRLRRNAGVRGQLADATNARGRPGWPALGAPLLRWIRRDDGAEVLLVLSLDLRQALVNLAQATTSRSAPNRSENGEHFPLKLCQIFMLHRLL